MSSDVQYSGMSRKSKDMGLHTKEKKRQLVAISNSFRLPLLTLKQRIRAAHSLQAAASQDFILTMAGCMRRKNNLFLPPFPRSLHAATTVRGDANLKDNTKPERGKNPPAFADNTENQSG